MLPLSTARRLLLPSLVLLTLALPVAAAPQPSPVDPLTFAQAPPRDEVTAPVGRSAAADLSRPSGRVVAPPPAAAVSAPRAPAPVVKQVAPASRPVRAARARPAAGSFRPGWESRNGHQALELITYPWRDLGWEISFHEARPGLLGLAYEPDKHIYIFVRRNQSIRSLAFTIAHEIGHAYDFTHSTRESHNRWLELRGIDRRTPWAGCNNCSDLETPAGDFAEVFAVWQVGAADFRSRMAPLPQGDRLRLLSQEFLATGPAANT